MDFFAERLFYAMVAADVALGVFFVVLCVAYCRPRPPPPPVVVAAVLADSCPILEESRPSSTS